MKKSCYLCENSIEVKYKLNREDNSSILFCIASPPLSGATLTKYTFCKRFIHSSGGWYKIAYGKARLAKYYLYPICGQTDLWKNYELAPCALYCKTKKQKKINRYEEILTKIKEKKEHEKAVILDKEEQRRNLRKALKKEAERKRKIKNKKKAERKRKLAKAKYQKEYKKRKKEEQERLKAKADDYNRFEIIDIR